MVVHQRVEFPMSSNNFSYSLATRCWDLLAEEGLHSQLFYFDKVIHDMIFLWVRDSQLHPSFVPCL